MRHNFFTQTLRQGVACALIFFGCAIAMGAVDRESEEDFEARSQVERYYSDKIRNTLPGLKFSLFARLKAATPVELPAVPFKMTVNPPNTLPLNRVASLQVVTGQEISVAALAPILGLKESQLSVKTVVIPEVAAKTSTVDSLGQASNSSNSPSSVKLEVSREYLFIFAGMLLALISLGVGIILSLKRMQSSVQEVAATNTAMTSAAASRGATESAVSEKESDKHKNTEDSAAVLATTEFTDDQLKAAFSECYWCAEDGSAAMLLRKYPRHTVYRTLSFGSDYVDYLRHVQPESDLGFLTDPYFNDPSEILLELSIEDTPKSWATSVSQMRLKKMALSAKEVLTLVWEKPSLGRLKNNCSPHRALETFLEISIRSIEEETELLSFLNDNQKLKLPSLYLLTLLPEADLKTLLDSYSVREISQAWIGPPEVLEKIEANLPPRKRELLKELDRNGNRESASFKSMLRKARTLLRTISPATFLPNLPSPVTEKSPPSFKKVA